MLTLCYSADIARIIAKVSVHNPFPLLRGIVEIHCKEKLNAFYMYIPLLRGCYKGMFLILLFQIPSQGTCNCILGSNDTF